MVISLKHSEVHPGLDVENCFGCKVAGVRMGMNTTTTRGQRVAEVNSTERGWQKDMPAYKRLRQNGLQPQSIDGCAEIEKKAKHEWQVETGIV
jgi:hypothetical protein